MRECAKVWYGGGGGVWGGSVGGVGGECGSGWEWWRGDEVRRDEEGGKCYWVEREWRE